MGALAFICFYAPAASIQRAPLGGIGLLHDMGLWVAIRAVGELAVAALLS